MDNVVTRPWRRLFDFQGRATRGEFWLLQLQILPIWLFSHYSVAFVEAHRDAGLGVAVLALLSLVLMLAIAIASLSAGVRRLHDQDKRGFLVLLLFVPLVGPLALLVLMLMPGTDGVNRFGYDPRDEDSSPSARTARVFS